MSRLSQILNLANTKSIELKNQKGKLWDTIISICKERQSNDFFIYEYTENTELIIICKSAKKNSEEISKKMHNLVSKYITIHSYLRGKENIISIDGHKSIYLYENELYDTKSYSALEHKWAYIHRIFCLSRALYHPSILLDISGEEKTLKKTQLAILQEILNCFKKIKSTSIDKALISKIEGGRVDKKSFIVKKSKTNNDSKEINAYLESILSKYDNLLFYNNNEYIQASSSNSWELIKIIKNKLNKSKFNKQVYDRFYYEISQNFIYNDFRLKRISLIDKKTNKTILYIFNNLEYEAMPCVNNNLLKIVIFRYELYNIIFSKDDRKDVDSKIEYVFNIFRDFILKKIDLYNLSYAGEYKEDKVEKIRLGGDMIRL